MATLLSIKGVPLIGLYIRVTEEVAVLGVRDRKAEQFLRQELEVDVIRTTISGSELVGALVAGNSASMIVSNHVLSKELERLKRRVDVKVVETNMTCLGNNLLLNDRGGIAHPELDENVIEEVSDFLSIKIARGTVGGIKTVGMAAVLTNRGALLNPNATEWEIKKIADVAGVKVETGTVNFGSDMVGTGVVANSKGYIAGEDTTGFELGVIEEALGFLEVVE